MIETERLTLREWRDVDRNAFLAMCSSPLVMEYLGGPADATQIDASIARQRACQAADGFCFWVVERQDDGAFLGFCGLKRATGSGSLFEGEVEIGWRLRAEAWGRGYGREAAIASLEWAWAHTDVAHIVAMTVPANRRSWGLMERIGMTRRPDLDFGHPSFAPDHPLHAHIVYVAERP